MRARLIRITLFIALAIANYLPFTQSAYWTNAGTFLGQSFSWCQEVSVGARVSVPEFQLVPGIPRRTHQSKSAGASRGEAAGRPSKRAQD